MFLETETVYWFIHLPIPISVSFRIIKDRYKLCAIMCQDNKANVRYLIATTGLVILLKLDSNCKFFTPCNLEIWWMTSKNDRAPLLYYVKLCASFQELQSGNAHFASKLVIFCPTGPWNLMDKLEKQQGTSSILHLALCIILKPSMNRGVTIHHGHDKIHIWISVSRYDPYFDTYNICDFFYFLKYSSSNLSMIVYIIQKRYIL